MPVPWETRDNYKEREQQLYIKEENKNKKEWMQISVSDPDPFNEKDPGSKKKPKSFEHFQTKNQPKSQVHIIHSFQKY